MVQEEKMRVAIFGTGAVGGYFGGRLAQAGDEVIFIARGEHLNAIRENGLRIDSIAGDFVVRGAHTTDDPATVGVVDAVIVGVKAWQVPEAAEALRPMLGPETCVVPLQNGVEAPAQLAGVLGDEHVLVGLCRIIAFIAGPGHVRHAGAEPYVAFSEMDDRPSDRVERLRRAFERAEGVTVEIPEDIQAALWRKFLLVAAWSGLGAITRAPVGIFRSQPETRPLLEGAMREIFHVAQARGVGLPPQTVRETMTFMDNLPPEGTASMQRDIMEGRPSELDSQNGAVLRLGQEAGVPTPLHAFIYHSLLPLERKARGELRF
jgi:2-dehydropantoate 2-reductase